MPHPVTWLPEATTELELLPAREQVAVLHAADKLQALGDQLRSPHQSAVKNHGSIREFRPRGGRSPWRAFYRRVADEFVIGAAGPEAAVDESKFRQAASDADGRISRYAETR
jgi:phage-related protein